MTRGAPGGPTSTPTTQSVVAPQLPEALPGLRLPQVHVFVLTSGKHARVRRSEARPDEGAGGVRVARIAHEVGAVRPQVPEPHGAVAAGGEEQVAV
eukprot:CAMPEP_0185753106 /NCGR_PEP_ID=MMETSP1174-20130828/11851_1 /TAXON_ID=35687 /ORGANISM="Dictyocha speculum, Strain CCMP1381" /LENGTH=95 /DNA_ID=CAMNT_0028430813 /DNA_START=111 /DNA_END=396 /DNA_ORIENTATION=+